MCKVFPSNLKLVAMRWFDGLDEGSISSYRGLTKAFGAKFVTCSRVPRPLDSLLSMEMRERETLKTYFDRGAVSFEAFRRGSSSHSFCSIHIRSLLFYEWCDIRGHHGAASVHGCSPRHSQ